MYKGPVSYWAWTLTFEDGAQYASLTRVPDPAYNVQLEALLPGVLEHLQGHWPRLRGHAPRDWSAVELSESDYRLREAKALEDMVRTRPAGPPVPRTAVAALLLGVCLLVLAVTLPGGRAPGGLLAGAAVLALVAGGGRLLLWSALCGDPQKDG
ncbi:hypothetical protein ABZY44_36560 [Streptomyces sp. NPDC006544]|uniref:hypothetical protein n=1 Tax=Streptomyces sp. NPDC006544 TaxID=3154583 RepID=UPI0033B2638E